MRWDNQVQPPTMILEDKTAGTPTRQRWDYSPVKLASYQQPVDDVQLDEQTTQEFYADVQIESRATDPQDSPLLPPQQVNSHWKSSQW